MENNKFKEVMSKKSDKEIIDIVFTRRLDYQPEAVLSAEIEYNNRNIADDLKEKFIYETQLDFEQIEIKSNKNLSTLWKILCFLLPGFIPLLIIIIDISLGYETRANQAMKWTGFGVLFYFSIGLISSLF